MTNNNYRLQKIISKLISLWMISITLTIINISKYADSEQKKIYNFGPNKNLNILGFIIDTQYKYILVITYCFINSIFRTLYNSILHSWMINHIQDETKEKSIEIRTFAYEITCVTTIYAWFDWFIYINILLSQIDMVNIEIIADLIVSMLTTTYYLRTQKEEHSLLLNTNTELNIT